MKASCISLFKGDEDRLVFHKNFNLFYRIVGYCLEGDRHWMDKAGIDIESLRHRNIFQRLISRIRIGAVGSGRRHSESVSDFRRHSEGVADFRSVNGGVSEPHPRFGTRSNSCDI